MKAFYGFGLGRYQFDNSLMRRSSPVTWSEILACLVENDAVVDLFVVSLILILAHTKT